MSRQAEEKFQSAATRHQQSAKRHVTSSSANSVDTSSDEDELDDEQILGSMLKSFRGSLGDDYSDIGSTGEYITNTVQAKASVCLICIETIKRNDPVRFVCRYWVCVCLGKLKYTRVLSMVVFQSKYTCALCIRL